MNSLEDEYMREEVHLGQLDASRRESGSSDMRSIRPHNGSASVLVINYVINYVIKYAIRIRYSFYLLDIIKRLACYLRW